MNRLKKSLVSLGLILFGTMIAFVFFEGVCNIAFVLRSLHRPVAERVHTRYDKQLGWVNIPNAFIRDMYGDGIYLRTNLQGFRNSSDFSISAPKDKIRVICSGDSFTLGYGVDNGHTWCQLLNLKDNRLEPVNMGQGGYGIDQAYLLYMREGAKLEHQIHIFALTAADFDRFGKSFLGYGKPCLKIQNDALKVYNVPVPRRSFYIPWLTENLRAFMELKSFRLFAFLYNKLFVAGNNIQDANNNDEKFAITLKILGELQKTAKLKHTKLIIVYLPVMEDFLSEDYSKTIRDFLDKELLRMGLEFVNLTDDFRKLPSGELNGLFIDEIKYPYSAGHYNARGNQYVAKLVYEKLLPLLAN